MKTYKKYLNEVFDKSPDMVLEVSVELPFVYKEGGVYLSDIKVGSFVGGNLFRIENNVDEQNFDFLIDYFDGVRDLKEGEVYPIEVEQLDVYDVRSSFDSRVDNRGDEYTFTLSDSYKLYYDNIEVTNILSSQDKEKVQEQIDDELNKSHKSKFVGTHRTY